MITTYKGSHFIDPDLLDTEGLAEYQEGDYDTPPTPLHPHSTERKPTAGRLASAAPWRKLLTAWPEAVPAATWYRHKVGAGLGHGWPSSKVLASIIIYGEANNHETVDMANRHVHAILESDHVRDPMCQVAMRRLTNALRLVEEQAPSAYQPAWVQPTYIQLEDEGAHMLGISPYAKLHDIGIDTMLAYAQLIRPHLQRVHGDKFPTWLGALQRSTLYKQKLDLLTDRMGPNEAMKTTLSVVAAQNIIMAHEGMKPIDYSKVKAEDFKKPAKMSEMYSEAGLGSPIQLAIAQYLEEDLGPIALEVAFTSRFKPYQNAMLKGVDHRINILNQIIGITMGIYPAAKWTAESLIYLSWYTQTPLYQMVIWLFDFSLWRGGLAISTHQIKKLTEYMVGCAQLIDKDTWSDHVSRFEMAMVRRRKRSAIERRTKVYNLLQTGSFIDPRQMGIKSLMETIAECTEANKLRAFGEYSQPLDADHNAVPRADIPLRSSFVGEEDDNDDGFVSPYPHMRGEEEDEPESRSESRPQLQPTFQPQKAVAEPGRVVAMLADQPPLTLTELTDMRINPWQAWRTDLPEGFYVPDGSVQNEPYTSPDSLRMGATLYPLRRHLSDSYNLQKAGIEEFMADYPDPPPERHPQIYQRVETGSIPRDLFLVTALERKIIFNLSFPARRIKINEFFGVRV